MELPVGAKKEKKEVALSNLSVIMDRYHHHHSDGGRPARALAGEGGSGASAAASFHCHN